MVARNETTIFVRDDDVGELTDAFCSFLACFKSRRIPVSYQVIPAKLSDACAARLRREHSDAPDLFEFGQHGLAHEMVVNGKRLGWEFGRERDFAAQEAAIAQGRDILQQKLADAFSGRVFTPPRHRFNRATLIAASRQGFDIFSASAYADPLHRMVYAMGRQLGLTDIFNHGVTFHGQRRPEAPIHELSIAVAIDNGAPCRRRVADVLKEIERARRSTDIVGLMVHHQAWNSKSGEAFLEELTGALIAIEGARFALLGEIASTSAGGDLGFEP